MGKISSTFQTVLAVPFALAGGWVAYSYLRIDHHAPLPKAIDAERQTFDSRSSSPLNYYKSEHGVGRPLILIHSINAAASSYEMRPLCEHYRKTRRVYALDLPGFGFSERANRIYAPELYQNAISEFMQTQVRDKADVVALSLGCEFAARAVLAKPEWFSSLVMISPSGLSQQAEQIDNRDWVYPLVAFPLWGRALYDLIVTRPSIRYFLKRSFEAEVDRGLAEYDYATSHQPGAHHAPLYFISGKLFTPDICASVYERLALPVLVIHDRDAFVRFDLLPALLARNANVRAVRIQPTKGLPHFEKLYETVATLDHFWSHDETRR